LFLFALYGSFTVIRHNCTAVLQARCANTQILWQMHTAFFTFEV